MLRLFDSVLLDLRYALRALRQSPAFAAVAILSLALGIGANTAIFSLLNSVLLKTLPVREPERLVKLSIGERNDSLTNPIWEAIRDHQQALDGMLAWGSTRLNLAQGGETRFAQGVFASGSYFQVLGVPALVGRTFTPEDDRRGCGADGPLVVLSYGFWQSRYGGAADAVGQRILLDGHPYTIIGVTPPSFFGLEVGRSFDLIMPLCTEPVLRGAESSLDQRSYWWLGLVGRLKDGSAISQAQASLRSLQPAVREATLPGDWPQEYLDSYLKDPFTLSPAGTGISSLRSRYQQALYVLMAVAALVLLIACANIANLQLARAAARERETALRVSLGASRLRVIRQLLIESVLLGAAGAAAGLAVAQWASRLLVYQLSTGTARVFLDLSPDLRVLAFAACAGILTGILFGILPALRAAGRPANDALRERSSISAEGRVGAGRWLVAAQVGLSLILLIGATLFIRSYFILATLDPGFDRSRVMIVTADMRRTNSAADSLLPQFEQLLEAVRTIPGIRSAALSVVTPISGSTWGSSVQVDGYQPKTDRDSIVHFNFVSPDFFDTYGTALMAGRDFDNRDHALSPRVAVVNQAMAQKFYAGRNPLGMTFRTRMGGKDYQSIGIVGVVRDAKYRTLREEAPPTAYAPISQVGRVRTSAFLSVKAARRASDLKPSIVETIGRIHPEIALTFRTLEEQVRDSLVQERLMGTLSALFGLLALVVAAVGLAGLVSYSVTRRRAEMGIRAALGATPGSLVRLILREVAWMTSIGLVFGIAASLAAGRFVSALLYGLEPTDPDTLAAAALILALVAAVAGYIPARRAARIDPMLCLRAE